VIVLDRNGHRGSVGRRVTGYGHSWMMKTKKEWVRRAKKKKRRKRVTDSIRPMTVGEGVREDGEFEREDGGYPQQTEDGGEKGMPASHDARALL
jgi:hypothetical protein